MISINLSIPIISLIFGILILLFPKLLRVLVGLYFTLGGILGIITTLRA